MSQFSSYSAPSMDGFNAFNSLHTNASVPPKDLHMADPLYHTKCFKVSNNKFPDCPAIMDDGRAFTDYRSPCYVNTLIKSENKIRNSYDYRQYLINNGLKIMNEIRLYNINKTSCRECEAKPINCKTVCIVGRNNGFAAKNCDQAFIMPNINNKLITPFAETTQVLVWHLLVSHPQLKKRETVW